MRDWIVPEVCRNAAGRHNPSAPSSKSTNQITWLNPNKLTLAIQRTETDFYVNFGQKNVKFDNIKATAGLNFVHYYMTQ